MGSVSLSRMDKASKMKDLEWKIKRKKEEMEESLYPESGPS